MARIRYTSLMLEPLEWVTALEVFSKGLYVDVGRLLIGGQHCLGVLPSSRRSHAVVLVLKAGTILRINADLNALLVRRRIGRIMVELGAALDLIHDEGFSEDIGLEASDRCGIPARFNTSIGFHSGGTTVNV